ncbi:hypothetical protein N657DRAFT_639538 [Parathielavia appendiculata]|uniref:Uncharacterized protein n=1 Tax=Parathielavia appendiculata TaxID=2587402 RepID=A0AAN6UA78_9PEZI|nr:hypothetical protein N657DRAFT_639538 [Parathielavia appendiculata]
MQNAYSSRRKYVRPIIAALPMAEKGKNRTQDRALKEGQPPFNSSPFCSKIYDLGRGSQARLRKRSLGTS